MPRPKRALSWSIARMPADRARIVGTVEQSALYVVGRHEIQERDAGFLLAIARLENNSERRRRRRDQLARVGRRHRQPRRFRGAVLPFGRFEAVGLGPDREAAVANSARRIFSAARAV